MALDLLTTTVFERDLRRVKKQGKDLDKLEAIVNLLQAQEQLPGRCRPLRGLVLPFSATHSLRCGLATAARSAGSSGEDSIGVLTSTAHPIERARRAARRRSV